MLSLYLLLLFICLVKGTVFGHRTWSHGDKQPAGPWTENGWPPKRSAGADYFALCNDVLLCGWYNIFTANFFLCSLGFSAWTMQCYVWKSSKMSLILNTKLTRWKVSILKSCGYIFASCVILYVLWRWVIKWHDSQLHVVFCLCLSNMETVIPLWKLLCSCVRWSYEERTMESFPDAYQQTEWM